MGSLTDALYNNMTSSMYPFHMPGHKRQMQKDGDCLEEIRGIDVTEIEGMDDLHNAQTVIADLQKRCAKLWGSDESRILINGSSCGVLAAILACMCEGGKLLLGRNAHKSAYNAINIGRIDVQYIYPESLSKYEICGAISPEEVERYLKADEYIRAVYITSPTYEGVISPVNEIADVCHRYGIPLIVDAAHGAHFGLYDSFVKKYGMEAAIKSGADISIESLHKTLPAFTQSGVLHYKRGFISEDRLGYYLSVFQSSSPSYILMAGVDRCVDILESNKKKLFCEYEEILERLFEKVNYLSKIHVLSFSEVMKASSNAAGFDVGKLVISGRAAGLTGSELAEMLRNDFKIETEMSAGGYVLAMTSIMDSKEGLERLADALILIDGRAEKTTARELTSGIIDETAAIFPITSRRMSISEAYLKDTEEIKLEKAVGYVSADFIFSYPPGIPVVAPGEILSPEIIDVIVKMKRDGIVLRGINEETVRVING